MSLSARPKMSETCVCREKTRVSEAERAAALPAMEAGSS